MNLILGGEAGAGLPGLGGSGAGAHGAGGANPPGTIRVS
jgi:UV excision repair protein RAD23